MHENSSLDLSTFLENSSSLEEYSAKSSWVELIHRRPNCNLKSLEIETDSMNWNFVGLVYFIAKLTNFEILRFRIYSVSNEDLVPLAPHLSKMSQILTMHIAMEYMDDKDAVDLEKLVCCLLNLDAFELLEQEHDAQTLGDDAATALASALSEKMGLLHISVQGIQFPADTLVPILDRSTNLKTLNLQGALDSCAKALFLFMSFHSFNLHTSEASLPTL